MSEMRVVINQPSPALDPADANANGGGGEGAAVGRERPVRWLG